MVNSCPIDRFDKALVVRIYRLAPAHQPWTPHNTGIVAGLKRMIFTSRADRSIEQAGAGAADR